MGWSHHLQRDVESNRLSFRVPFELDSISACLVQYLQHRAKQAIICPFILMRYGYQLYGLRVIANRARPEAFSFPTDAWPTADIFINFHESQPFPASAAQLPWYAAPDSQSEYSVFQQLQVALPTGLHHRLKLSSNDDDATHALISPTAQPGHRLARAYQIDVYWHNSTVPPDETYHTVVTWVFDIALGFTVRLCVPANLHGSALAVDGRVVAFLGQKGAGKSTLTAAMVKAGWPMLADDHVAIWPRDQQFWVEPGAPRLRLWPSSLPVIDKQADELPRLYTFQEKRLLALQEGVDGQPAEFQPTALPLAAIYLLEARDPIRTEPTILPLETKEALYELLLKRFSTIAISAAHATAELSVLAQIAQQVPVKRVYRPDGLETLPHLIECIRHDLTRQAAATGMTSSSIQ